MNRLMVFICRTTAVSARLLATKAPAVSDKSKPKAVSETNAQFDQVTHTGQAWDKADYRLQRFDDNAKMINPNIAAHLIAEQPPIALTDRIAKCDGGHPALGHPAVFINLDKPGTHACGYCGQRFYNTHSTKPEDLSVQHIEV